MGETSRFPTIFISFTGMRTICDLTCFAIWIFHASVFDSDQIWLLYISLRIDIDPFPSIKRLHEK